MLAITYMVYLTTIVNVKVLLYANIPLKKTNRDQMMHKRPPKVNQKRNEEVKCTHIASCTALYSLYSLH